MHKYLDVKSWQECYPATFWLQECFFGSVELLDELGDPILYVKRSDLSKKKKIISFARYGLVHDDKIKRRLRINSAMRIHRHQYKGKANKGHIKIQGIKEKKRAHLSIL